MVNKTGLCPKCGANWDGGDIWNVLRNHPEYKAETDEQITGAARCYGWTPERKTHFSKLIGIHSSQPDRHTYECPECREQWHMFQK